MYKDYMKIASVIIVSFIIIYLGSLVSWIFEPIIVFIQTLFIPILLASLLFYIFKPFVQLLSRYMPKALAIAMLYLAFVIILSVLLYLIIPEIQHQIGMLTQSMPNLIDDTQALITDLQQNQWVQQFDFIESLEVEDQVEEVGQSITDIVGDFVSGTLSVISVLFNFIITLFVVPFLLFYMLKEGEKFPKSFTKFVPEDKHHEVKQTFKELDETLSHYIQGILIVCLSIGVLCYIAFSIVGLDFALILAMIAMVTNVIPYVGPWIGAVPSVTVGLLQSPAMAVTVIIIIVIIQQIESIFIQPQVMGKKLSMHPVTVLFLVLAAGRFAGIFGMIVAVPFYAISKVIVTHVYRLIKIKKMSASS
ncbi:Predicted PurR-regulated permease PerM [Pelagirhabdus alkalitolerans]|uniref:Predicted PurR-regulated permease PerM n=1 Tax=Pelagirhabdus alkalitolerans TaxID=1612202 RepID=A0A1G6H602_9BACI|nr:AI-2E family transporter [Pelagirhabdus alkalitolerans]SDB89672.1 Predicted PurR-regulated permease PerM [Pelagirhabdus alkalitolerans]